MKLKKGLILGFWLNMCLIMAPFASWCADNENEEAVKLESVTVTANKMEENPQDLPNGISVLTDINIIDRSINETADIFKRMPNMHMTKSGPIGGYEKIASVRGITSYMSGGSVYGFFVDDVYYPIADVNLLDVERVEVLRGPQGTLYGHNAEAAVINIITKAPENQWSGEANISYGNYNTKEIGLTGNGALIRDKLFLRLAGRYYGHDGFYENIADGDDKVDKGETYDGKIALLFKPSEKLTADLKVNSQDYDSNYAEFSTFDKVMNGDFEVTVNDPGEATRKFNSTSLKMAYDMENVRLTSITAALKDDTVNMNDVDFTEHDIMKGDVGAETSLYTQEFRVNSLSETSPLKWTSGVYLFNGEEDRHSIIDLPVYLVTSRQYGHEDRTGVAVFGQADYTLGPFVITAGLRYENERKNFDYRWRGGAAIGYAECTGSSEKTFEALLPKFALTYNITDSFRTYVSAARGFKSGGFNLNSEPGDAFNAEYTWNYELGFKSELADNKVQLNAALFYIEWQDLQVEQPSYPDFTIDNAAEATSKGVELELTLRPVAGLDIYGSMGYVDAKFDEYILGAEDYKDKNIPNAPSHTYSLGATYRFLEHWMVNAEIYGTGKIYYNTENSKAQDSYEIVDLKAGYETERFDVYVWANNLLDEVYATRAFEMDGQWFARNGDPLAIGVDFRFRF
jgi:iron complex outermembrane receptor protein